MAVRHLGELRKKKNPMEPELKSRFTNPPTLSAYISHKPQRPGHRQTYAKSLRGSRGPGSRRLPQPEARAARCPRCKGQPGCWRTLAWAPRAPARHLQPPLPPRDAQTEPRGLQETKESRTRGKKPPPPRPNRCAPPPPASRTGTGNAGGA